MIELGKIQNLEVKRKTSIGVFLNTGQKEESEDILLPRKEVPKDIEQGDAIKVFVYRDSEDRMISTTRDPKITLGEVGYLKVVEITRIGAFLDWGLERDLFLPFREQTTKLEKGRRYLIALYIDKSQRLCGTMKIRDFLQTDSPYKENDWVKGIIYSVNHEFGAFVAVDKRYEGLIPKRELMGVNVPGEEVNVRITNVKKDGKLDLSLRDMGHIEISNDVEKVLDKIKDNGGSLYLNDHSSPKDIRRELAMSKSAFKKAVGRLLKEERIEFIKDGIKLR